MVNPEIRLIIFFAAKDGEALYSQQKKTGSRLWLRSWAPYCHISSLNAEQIQIRKVVLQNRLALDILTAARGGTFAIIHTQCCTYIPDMSTNGTHFTKHMDKMIQAMYAPEASIASL